MGSQSSFYAETGPTYQGDNPASSSNDGEIVVAFIADGSGSFEAAEIPISFGCTIKGATLVGDTVGNLTVDVLSAPLATFPGALASICASAKPTLEAAQTSQDTLLTGWATTIAPNTVLRFSPSGSSGLSRAVLTLQITKG